MRLPWLRVRRSVTNLLVLLVVAMMSNEVAEYRFTRGRTLTRTTSPLSYDGYDFNGGPHWTWYFHGVRKLTPKVPTSQ